MFAEGHGLGAADNADLRCIEPRAGGLGRRVLHPKLAQRSRIRMFRHESPRFLLTSRRSTGSAMARSAHEALMRWQQPGGAIAQSAELVRRQRRGPSSTSADGARCGLAQITPGGCRAQPANACGQLGAAAPTGSSAQHATPAGSPSVGRRTHVRDQRSSTHRRRQSADTA